jgi:hypothetical protein
VQLETMYSERDGRVATIVVNRPRVRIARRAGDDLRCGNHRTLDCKAKRVIDSRTH